MPLDDPDYDGCDCPCPAPGAFNWTLSVDVTTLSPGSDATGSVVVTDGVAVFSFGIPRGATGAKGDAGAAATIAVGTTTTLTPGNPATVANSGSSSAAVLNFGIPRGPSGNAATLAIGTVTTLSAGSSATATNVGTSAAAIFNLGIPRGADGSTGTVNAFVVTCIAIAKTFPTARANYQITFDFSDSHLAHFNNPFFLAKPTQQDATTGDTDVLTFSEDPSLRTINKVTFNVFVKRGDTGTYTPASVYVGCLLVGDWSTGGDQTISAAISDPVLV